MSSPIFSTVEMQHVYYYYWCYCYRSETLAGTGCMLMCIRLLFETINNNVLPLASE